MSSKRALKDCYFLGSTRRDLVGFPEDVRGDIGHALHQVQRGREPYSAKVLKGFGGRGVLELVENHDGKTYRAVYTIHFAGTIYVLHCFQKKSKSGIATPLHDIAVVKARLQTAETHHRTLTRRGD